LHLLRVITLKQEVSRIVFNNVNFAKTCRGNKQFGLLIRRDSRPVGGYGVYPALLVVGSINHIVIIIRTKHILKDVYDFLYRTGDITCHT